MPGRPAFDRLVGLDCFVGHGDAEPLLRLHHGDPQFAEHDLALGDQTSFIASLA